MNIYDYVQVLLYFIILFSLAPFLGSYMAKVFTNKKTFADILIKPVEKSIYKISGVKPEDEMDWKQYAIAMLIFNLLGIIVLFFILLFQKKFPLNPQNFKGTSWHLALNTAVSFVTNTNWQSYSGESTLSYFSQMAGLAVQNFLSAATGIAIVIALIRGLINKGTNNLGNFWVDLGRSTLYITFTVINYCCSYFDESGCCSNIVKLCFSYWP